MSKPNCYECQHRGEIPGDAHSRCLHPAIGGQLKHMAVVARQLHVTGHESGIRAGWFFWPVNFDPTWLLTCNGFEAK